LVGGGGGPMKKRLYVRVVFRVVIT
jgi:hypothetical protein